MKKTLVNVYLISIMFIVLLNSCSPREIVSNPSSREYESVSNPSPREDELSSQSSDFPETMYVNATDGLIRRSEPSIDSIRIGTYSHGEKVTVLERSQHPVTIEGITDYWYKTQVDYWVDEHYNSSWVFGSYLSENRPLNIPVIIGSWRDDRANPYYYKFRANYSFLIGLSETNAGYEGTWSLNENIIKLEILYNNMDADEDEFELIVMDFENINLLFKSGEVRLKRYP
jgi:hypothetical protein